MARVGARVGARVDDYSATLDIQDEVDHFEFLFDYIEVIDTREKCFDNYTRDGKPVTVKAGNYGQISSDLPWLLQSLRGLFAHITAALVPHEWRVEEGEQLRHSTPNEYDLLLVWRHRPTLDCYEDFFTKTQQYSIYTRFAVEFVDKERP